MTTNLTLRLGVMLAVVAGIQAGFGQVAGGQQAGVPMDSARAHQTPTQHDVAKMLIARDAATRSEGLRLAQMVRPEHVGPELRIGLVIALDGEGATYQAHLRSNRQAGRGNGAARSVSVTHDRLLTTVAALKDTMAIPALAMSLGTGMTPVRALTEFGQPAAAMTLRVASAPAEHQQVADALLVLRLMAENVSLRPLTPATRAQMHAVAASHLSGTQPFDVLWRTIDLAVVLGDADLRQTVAALATDQREAGRRGIQDASEAAELQRQARDRLAGVPAQPRH
jgi:hypothetical protein